MEDALTDTDLPRDKSQEGLFYVSPEELARRLRSDRAPLVLDVRDPNELEGELGQLPGALNIPLGQLQQRIGELSSEEDVQKPPLESFGTRDLSESSS
jgi:3-mercaptopyruvate sulfurtransferase SseA